ncbi:hypothetical protein FB45DRAFT_862593 [Roridomyces roridus]|uniref:Uncharacterized protein n=1 Tax=Roridomyces roridus TaxID=1738132 RepID=A0AAD7C7U3_9AGAR|nr:hypothetical protein FB45DRAFT_862593 [Roridomyces roridus]
MSHDNLDWKVIVCQKNWHGKHWFSSKETTSKTLMEKGRKRRPRENDLVHRYQFMIPSHLEDARQIGAGLDSNQSHWYFCREGISVPDPRLTGIPDKDDRSKNDRNSGTKDSGEGRKVGGGRWSPTGDTTKTQGDRVPYATSKGSNPDETIKEERRARSSQGRIDQEHEYGESDKVKNSDPGVEVDTLEKPEKPEGVRSEYLHRSKVEWVKDGMKLKKGKSPNEDWSPVKIDPDLLEPEPELGQDWCWIREKNLAGIKSPGEDLDRSSGSMSKEPEEREVGLEFWGNCRRNSDTTKVEGDRLPSNARQGPDRSSGVRNPIGERREEGLGKTKVECTKNVDNQTEVPSTKGKSYILSVRDICQDTKIDLRTDITG